MTELVQITRIDLLDYMNLLVQTMRNNKMDYNRLIHMQDFEGKADILQSLKEQNQRYRNTWVRLNKNGAHGYLEIFNATKLREINNLLC